MDNVIRSWEEYLDVTPEELALVREISPVILESIPETLERLYGKIQHQGWTSLYIVDEATVRQMKAGLRLWLEVSLTGLPGQDLVSMSERVAHRLVGLGTDMRHVTWTFRALSNLLVEAVLNRVKPDAGLANQIKKAIENRLTLCYSLIVSTYTNTLQETVLAQSRALKEENRRLQQRTRELEALNCFIQQQLLDQESVVRGSVGVAKV